MRYKVRDQKGLNFITLTIVDWIDLFTRKEICDIVIENLAYCRKEKGLSIFGYVIMPSHLHLIVRANEEKGLSNILKEFKSYTARKVINYLQDYKQPESRRKWMLDHFKKAAIVEGINRKHKIWQAGNHPIELYTPKVIRQKLGYIHHNPVAAGIVESGEHYLNSSAQNYQRSHLPKNQMNCNLEIDLLDGIWNDQGFVFV